MTDLPSAALPAANSPGLRDARQRLIELDDAIARIRTQIATADLARQQHRKPIDPDWFHKARTALRHLCRERAELLALGTAQRRREAMKDAVIGVLRERHDEEAWAAVLAEARLRSEGEGA